MKSHFDVHPFDRRIARAAAQVGLPLAEQRPAFAVQIATNYNGNGRLLQWAKPLTMPGQRLLGRFDCYPRASNCLLEDWDAPPAVRLPLALADEILDAFRAGVVRAEAVTELADAIRKARS